MNSYAMTSVPGDLQFGRFCITSIILFLSISLFKISGSFSMYELYLCIVNISEFAHSITKLLIGGIQNSIEMVIPLFRCNFNILFISSLSYCFWAGPNRIRTLCGFV